MNQAHFASPALKEAPKHERIIQAALRVFAEHGLHGTAVPPIAAEAGVGVGTLYRYFDGKEALINAVFRDTKQRLQEHLLDGLDLMHPTRPLFNTLWARLTTFARQQPEAFQFLEMQDHHSYLNAESRSQEQALLIPLGMMVIIGQRTGLLSERMKPDLAIALFWGAFVGVFKAERLGYLTLTDDDLERARDACWLAIAAQPGDTTP
ncbi:AcrR family transcriptional regulator [Alcanivorax hongdengensis A-11-3]|uniref:AcrR family transcriptional regulator n=1 Tax=Alcanivorax hongdengensis A-11-3 TaxID=1177179 RepID=L0W7L0_9GAMM|nr:TetR/AcrR family transcriptional regulator [Alcanivorax hongdengensis]EKF72909.1 AcrR family transcriptional regulator [Alcanivorax hongdengensis A-11-3]